ncbi:hypothetical protein [Nostoc sp. MG11]|nr:hypothetical protein [Nostoc sp. MG11]
MSSVRVWYCPLLKSRQLGGFFAGSIRQLAQVGRIAQATGSILL